jgi:hypothetical protein
MLLSEFVLLMQEDLKNEWAHLRFYTHYAALISGPPAAELGKMFQEHARDEHTHVTEFAALLVSIGATPVHAFADYPALGSKLPAPVVLDMAARLEAAVAENYVARLQQLQTIDVQVPPPGMIMLPATIAATVKYLTLFYERQLEDSLGDSFRFTQLAAVQQ